MYVSYACYLTSLQAASASASDMRSLLHTFLVCMLTCMFMSAYTVCVWMCVFRRGQRWESLAWQTAVLFLGGLPLPSGGPHWRVLALSVSPSQAPGVGPSPAEQARWLQKRTTPLELWPVHGSAPTALPYTQMAGLLIGSRALHFHWCSASGSGGSRPRSENIHSVSVVQYCIHVYAARLVLFRVLWCSIS